ncbi:acyl-CoA thioesterase [Undibacterium oligocarboniphilum]|uniref:Acyl-CoA thioesterase n=1 Tax=Undibacterium oligocarboniphilum TaxID=666702 RepID=A0A850QID1_9BURK|nr:thioesterase family protein [Undibacterium oligocarboniphilum]MBC3869225.1 acyl-CoA thioesterase [Undibacterium oligocarboniphilum]NVO77205.1 acyl-CoA thioesterase [Undibacterium oligocarboniphilum]
MKIQAKKRCEFGYFHDITTRWMDNDAYGHVNNVVYYSWFDTIVNQFLISNQVLDVEKSEVIGLVIETQCHYFSSVAFPEKVVAGVAVTRLGNSSVRYEVGIFKENEDIASAQGHFVHVYVDRSSRRPVSIPSALRQILESIQREAA